MPIRGLKSTALQQWPCQPVSGSAQMAWTLGGIAAPVHTPRSIGGEARPVRHGRHAFKLSFEAIGLTAQFVLLTGPLPRGFAPFALAEPGRDPADNKTESEGP